MKVYSELENAQLEISSGNPTTGLATGRIIFDSATGTVKYYNGSGWIQISTGASGGGGGSSIAWTNEGPNAALLQVENSNLVYVFGAGLSQQIRTTFIVPQALISGSPITLYLSCYSPSTTNSFLLSGSIALIRNGTDAITSSSLTRVTTNTSLANTVANQLRRTILDITDTSGKIGGTLVAGGDMISVTISRGTDTDTGDIRALATGTEVKFS